MVRRIRSGSFAAEVLVAALVVAAVAIPLLTLLFQERDTEQRSRFEYLAVLAARDEMYESRMALAAGAQPDALAHDWKPLAGNVLERLAGAAPDLTIDARYSPEQARVATQLRLEPAGSSRLRVATLDARWMEPQTAAGPEAGRERPSSLQLVFGLLPLTGSP